MVREITSAASCRAGRSLAARYNTGTPGESLHRLSCLMSPDSSSGTSSAAPIPIPPPCASSAWRRRPASTVRWRPFLLGPIFKALRLERFALQHLRRQGPLYVAGPRAHLRSRGPAAQAAAGRTFRRIGLKAARLALLGESEGWTPPSPAPCSPRTSPSNRTSAMTRCCARSSRRSASMPKQRFAAAERAGDQGRAASARPRRLRRAGLFGAPSFTSAMNCSGATTGSKPRLPGLRS